MRKTILQIKESYVNNYKLQDILLLNLLPRAKDTDNRYYLPVDMTKERNEF